MTLKEQNNGLSNFLSARRFRTGRHLLFISVLVSVSIAQSYFVFGEDASLLGMQVYVYTVSLALTYIAFGYFNLYYLAPRILMRNNYVQYFMVLFGLLALILGSKYLVENRMLLSIGKGRIFNWIVLLDGVSNLVINGIGMAGSVVTLLFNQWIRDTGRIGFLENNKLKTSIETIKNQINPRLLFSTVSYAASRVELQPGKTSAALIKLSEVLRYTLYDCKREKVLLVSDIQFIRNYLDLEREQQENKLAYSIVTEGKTNIFVPPFQFMPLVQEMVQKGANNINVLFETTENAVKFECRAAGIDSVRRQLNRC